MESSAAAPGGPRPHEQWSGRVGFILATVGSAVGIGSIWKFPYEVGANGGGVFVLFYLAGLVLVVVPLLLAEFALGRAGRADAAASLAAVARAHARPAWWSWVGAFGALTAFLILSFYSVILGWTLGYAIDTAWDGAGGADVAAVRARHDAFLAAPVRMVVLHGAVMVATMLVVARGISGGLERAARLLMPLLGVLIVALAVFSVSTGDAAQTVAFLFRPDLSRLTPGVAIEALGLGFFSIGVGLGLMITYAAYSGADINLREVAWWTVAGDTVISLLAGFAVFPIVFAHGLDPAGGAGLVFVTLPLAFAGIPGGTVAACAFFVLLLVAGITSAISMLEMVVAMLVRWRGWTRRRATVVSGAACFLAGVPSALSFNLLAHWHPLHWLPGFAQATVFDVIDTLTSNLMLPAGALGLALFVAWVLPQPFLASALHLRPDGARLLRALLRYVVPLVIVAATAGPLLR